MGVMDRITWTTIFNSYFLHTTEEGEYNIVTNFELLDAIGESSQ